MPDAEHLTQVIEQMMLRILIYFATTHHNPFDLLRIIKNITAGSAGNLPIDMSFDQQYRLPGETQHFIHNRPQQE